MKSLGHPERFFMSMRENGRYLKIEGRSSKRTDRDSMARRDAMEVCRALRDEGASIEVCNLFVRCSAVST